MAPDAGAAAEPAALDSIDDETLPGRAPAVPYVDDGAAEAAMAAMGRFMDAVVKVHVYYVHCACSGAHLIFNALAIHL